MPFTRFGLEGVGVRRAGSFAGKTAVFSGPHPVVILTRLSADGYGARRYKADAFAGKTADAGGKDSGWLPVYIRRFRGR